MDGAINRMIESLTAVSKISNTEPDGITYGTIKSLNPLSVLVDGHSVPLPEEFFILGQNVRPHKVTIPHKHEYNGQTENNTSGPTSHNHIIKKQQTEDLHEGTSGGYKQDYVVLDIYPPLAVNDRVLMIRSNDGQKYYILERIEAEE